MDAKPEPCLYCETGPGKGDQKAIIQLSRVGRRYPGGVAALAGLDLTIPRGEWLAIMGPSGSGKTTLLNLIGCLDRPTEGTILINDVDTTRFGERELTRFRRETIGLVFQQFHLVPYLTALENVMIAQYFHSMSDEGEALSALERVGLRDRARHLPSQLSGGEQQRVCVARALINHPKIVLADEPTGNLDEENERIVMGLFRELHRAGHTIVTVTHDMEVGKLADRRIELHHGVLTDLTLSQHDQLEAFDEVLEQLWKMRERHQEAIVTSMRVPDVVDNLATFRAMGEHGMLAVAEGRLLMTEKGEKRARDVVRRHRLAEKLFTETLELAERQVKGDVCQIEHILSSDVTDSICAFLGHPKVCPHGNAIPSGDCCNGAPATSSRNPA